MHVVYIFSLGLKYIHKNFKKIFKVYLMFNKPYKSKFEFLLPWLWSPQRASQPHDNNHYSNLGPGASLCACLFLHTFPSHKPRGKKKITSNAIHQGRGRPRLEALLQLQADLRLSVKALCHPSPEHSSHNGMLLLKVSLICSFSLFRGS